MIFVVCNFCTISMKKVDKYEIYMKKYFLIIDYILFFNGSAQNLYILKLYLVLLIQK